MAICRLGGLTRRQLLRKLKVIRIRLMREVAEEAGWVLLLVLCGADRSNE